MNTSATDHDPKTALPPLANIISPSNSPTNLQQPSHYQAQQQQQQQMQPQQMQPQQMQHHLMMQNQNYSNFQQSSPNQNQSSMFYPPPITSNTSNLNDSNMLRFMNDYANQNNSSQLLSNFYPSINQLRSANTSHHSPSQYSMNSNTPLQMEMMESSNDILKHRQQSPLINQYYQNIQQQQQAQQLHQKLVSPSNSFGASMSMNTSGSNDLAITLDASTIPAKCMCKQPDVKRIPRPRNAFILFRQKHHQALIEEDNTVKTNPDVSRELGRRWRALSPADKDYWNKLAEEEKRLHAEKYPDYKYTPKRNGKKKCDYCIYKKQLKDQMNEKAAQRRIEKEQKRLEKHYQKQLLEQQKQQKQQQKQQQQQQQQSVATPSSTTSSSHQSQQQQQQQQQLMHQPQPHHHHQINQLASASEYVSQYGTGNTFNDMNLSNYQRLTQQFKPPTPMTNPYYTSGYQQQPSANPAATSQLQHPQPQHIQQQQQPPQQQQQQQQQQQNAPIMSSNSVQPNQYVKQEFQKNYLPYNNPQQSQDAQQTQQQQFNGSNSSIPIIESPNNLRVPQQKQQPSSMYNTNPSNPSRSGTPFDYSSYNQAPHQDNKHLVDGQEIKDHSQLNQAEAHPTVLPSINDLSLPPMNISQ